MTEMLKKIILIIILLALILVGGCDKQDSPDAELARCIGERSTLYISTGCIACAHQKNLFGENFIYLNVIDCKEQPQKCVDADILSVPTWIIDGEKYSGSRPIEQLKQLTGC